jgi:1-acyl-sn-glycerol-3-phosphate acyltransferase
MHNMIRNLFHALHFAWLCLSFVALIVPSFFITLLLLPLQARARDTAMYRLMQLAAFLWFLLGGIWPRRYHSGKVKHTRSVILLANHSCYLDAAIIYTGIPFLFKSLGKIEIKNTPLYGLIYQTVVITVDRNSAGGRAGSLRRLKRELMNGVSVLIFPEGTFPDEPSDALLSFQQGGFALAQMEQADIQPLLFLDAGQRMHPSSLWKTSPGMCRTVFLPALPTAGLSRELLGPFREHTRLYMQACLDHCRAQGAQGVWDFALLWLQQHPLPSA